MNNTAISIFANTITEQKNKQTQSSLWGGSIFEDIDTLKNDYSGKAGELLALRLCEAYNIDHDYDEDIVNQDDGTYDITIKEKLVEVKTARVGSDGATWQHESLRDHGCDYFWFTDVVPDGYYLSIFPAGFNFKQKHPVFGRTPHLRKETGGTYKFDFGPASLKKGESAGWTLFVDANTTDKEIKNFINQRIP